MFFCPREQLHVQNTSAVRLWGQCYSDVVMDSRAFVLIRCGELRYHQHRYIDTQFEPWVDVELFFQLTRIVGDRRLNGPLIRSGPDDRMKLD